MSSLLKEEKSVLDSEVSLCIQLENKEQVFNIIKSYSLMLT